MRIGFDGKRITHNFRGLGNYSRGIVEGLIQFHPEIEILIYSPPIKDPRAFEWLKTWQKKLILKTPTTLLSQILHPRWRSHWIVSDITRDQVQIYHGLSHEIPFGINDHSTKWIVTIHDLIFLRYPHFYSRFDRWTYLHKVKYAVEKADLVIAICEQTKQDLIQFLNVDENKIVVHYQSTSPLYFKSLSDSNLSNLKHKHNLPEKYILNVGALEERKNQIGLLKAYAKIAAQIDEDLVLVGRGDKFKIQLLNLAESLGITGRLHICSKIPTDDLPGIYQMATVFCFPSFFEGFGIPITEAQASGIPVVVSQGSCFPECASPESIFVDPNDIESIAKGLMQVLKDPQQRQKMSARGKEFAQKFTLQNSTEALVQIYKKILTTTEL